jgi:archaellum biogenesis ATPase FlaH
MTNTKLSPKTQDLFSQYGKDCKALAKDALEVELDGNVIPFPKKGNGAAPLSPDRAQTERFLALLDPAASGFTFQTLDDDKARKDANYKKRRETNERRKAKGLPPLKSNPDSFAHVFNGTLDKYWSELCRLNAQRVGIFITVNQTDGKGRKKENIKRVRALFNDLDGAPLEPVMQSKTPPHIVVASSPGKYHTYQLVTGITLEQFEPLQKTLAAQFGGDPKVHDLPRVLRLPGFLHHKGEPFLTHIVSTHNGRAYTVNDFPNRAEEYNDPYESTGQAQKPRSAAQQLNDAALANLAAWVPEIFPAARPYQGDGFRVSSSDLGRENEEDLSFHRDGIKDFGVCFDDPDLNDPRDGRRTPIDIVMEYVLEVPVEEIAARTNTVDFQEACDWLRERLPPDKTKKEDPPLQFVDLTLPLVDRQWLVADRIPMGNVTLFSGEGGAGKSILAKQLAAAAILREQWFGLTVMQGKVLYLSCEEDEDELRRRFQNIAEHYGSTREELMAKGLHLISRVEEASALAVYNHKANCLEQTKFFKTMHAAAVRIQPKLIVLDTSADVFGGNEIDRNQVSEFIKMLRKTGRAAGGAAVLLLSHPSVSGKDSGSGISGSTAWFNRVRSHIYLTANEDGERQLVFKKNQYGPKGETIGIQYSNGVFLDVTINVEPKDVVPPTELFMQLLDRYTEDGRSVSHKSGTTYAPALFCKEPEAKKAGVGNKELVQAMLQLFSEKKIMVITRGSASRERTYIARYRKEQVK